MTTIFDESGKTKVTIDDAIEQEFAVLEETIGKKKACRISRSDRTSFRVNIKGVGFVPTVSSILYEEVSGGCLLFWAHKSIAFRTESLSGKLIHMISATSGDIYIELE